MNREKLLQLKQENRENPALYNLIGVIIGECDRVGKDLSEEQIIAVMKKMYKNNEETITLNSMNQASLNITQFEKENEFLNTFFPKQLDTTEIKEIIDHCLFVEPDTNIGKLMRHFKLHYEGLYDGKLVSSIAKQALEK